MRTPPFILIIAVFTCALSSCLLTKGRFSQDGSMWIWNNDPGGRYNAHNPLQVDKATEWINAVSNIPRLKTLQVELTYRKNYEINDSNMFFGSGEKELPNYHSHFTFAKRLDIEPAQLETIVRDFDKLGLNRFYREENFIAFKTLTSLSWSRGYFYFPDSTLAAAIKEGDVIDLRQNNITYFREALFNDLRITKKFDNHWLEWEEGDFHGR
jgi:hypothetical protein